MTIHTKTQHRRGSVFLFILAVIGVLFAVALGLLASSQAASTSGFETTPELLAKQAADDGLTHAVAEIHEAFLRRKVPSNPHDGWRTHFWPVDTHRVDEYVDGRGAFTRGQEGSPWDVYENDVKVDNLLTEYYLHQHHAGGGYLARMNPYSKGYLNHLGTGRWYEPGVYSQQPIENPLSWHLVRWSNTDSIAPDPGSDDPALRLGEGSAGVEGVMRLGVVSGEFGVAVGGLEGFEGVVDPGVG